MSWAITSFENKFNLKKRSGLIKPLDNGFYVKFMQLEIGLLTLDTCRESMGIELSLQDIDRCHRIGIKTQQEVLSEPEENGQVKHQKVRPIIVKFTLYRRRQQVFSAKKNLKGKHVGISENLTKIRPKNF